MWREEAPAHVQYPAFYHCLLELGPGNHTLQLVLADANRMVHDPPVASEQIPILVRNLEVKKLGGEESSVYELSADLAIRWTIDSEPSLIRNVRPSNILHN